MPRPQRVACRDCVAALPNAPAGALVVERAAANVGQSSAQIGISLHANKSVTQMSEPVAIVRGSASPMPTLSSTQTGSVERLRFTHLCPGAIG
jgi:hypothetical protein